MGVTLWGRCHVGMMFYAGDVILGCHSMWAVLCGTML